MLFKITVLGEGGVGKTALTVQVSVYHVSPRSAAIMPVVPCCKEATVTDYISIGRR